MPKIQSPKLIRFKEPARRPGVAWTALALVLAAGSGAMNITGWLADIDPDVPLSLALGGSLVAVCVVSEGGQLLALHNAEKAFKARPYGQWLKGATMIGLGLVCAGWNAYSAHRAIDALNRHNAELVWDAYLSAPNLLANLNSQLQTTEIKLTSLTQDHAPAWTLYQAQLKRITETPPAQSTLKLQAEANASLAAVNAWLVLERARLNDIKSDTSLSIDVERKRVTQEAEAGRIGEAFQIGLAIGIEAFKLLMLWAGALVEKRRGKKPMPINWAAYAKPVRHLGKLAKIIPFRRKAA